MTTPKTGKLKCYYTVATFMLLLAVLALAARTKEEPKQLHVGRFAPMSSDNQPYTALDTTTGRTCLAIPGSGLEIQWGVSKFRIPSCSELLPVEDLDELLKLDVQKLFDDRKKKDKK